MAMSAEHISKLTDSQRAYLRLVLEHRSSKEIAQQFGISAHTVDKRIKEAMRILGVSSRIEAARMLQSVDNPASAVSYSTGASASPPAAPADRRERGFPLPFPTSSQPSNELSLLQRAGWMIGLIIGLALATGILLSGLTALSTLLIALAK